MATVVAKYGKCNNDEIYVGNINTLVEVGIIKSLDSEKIEYRLGDIALDIHGKKINATCIKPLFIKKGLSYTKYNNLMMKQLRELRK